MTTPLERRPIVVALAGPNGAGKTTYFHSHLAAAALRFVDPDRIARALGLDATSAMKVAEAVRRELVKQRESFVFETVFSDPAGDKLSFLEDAEAAGYSVVLCFIGVSGPEVCERRVAMRVAQGGHAIPPDRLVARYPRTLANLRAAIRQLPYAIVIDNDDLRRPFRRVAVFEQARATFRADPLPVWLVPLLL